MRDRVLARNPGVGIQLFDGDIVAERIRLERILERCDVVIGATDNNRSRFVLNRFAVDAGIPTIYGRAYVRACGGDVVVVRPDGPCYVCLFGEAAPDEEVSSARSGQAPAYADVEVAPEPGLSLDIRPIADMCARVAIVELLRDTDARVASLTSDLPASVFLWANRRDGQFAHWEPMEYRKDHLSVLRWYALRTEEDPHCPVCHPDAFMKSMITDADDNIGLDSGPSDP